SIYSLPGSPHTSVVREFRLTPNGASVRNNQTKRLRADPMRSYDGTLVCRSRTLVTRFQRQLAGANEWSQSGFTPDQKRIWFPGVRMETYAVESGEAFMLPRCPHQRSGHRGRL